MIFNRLLAYLEKHDAKYQYSWGRDLIFSYRFGLSILGTTSDRKIMLLSYHPPQSTTWMMGIWWYGGCKFHFIFQRPMWKKDFLFFKKYSPRKQNIQE